MWLRVRSSLVVASSTANTGSTNNESTRRRCTGVDIARNACVMDVSLRYFNSHSNGRGTPHVPQSLTSARVVKDEGHHGHGGTHASPVPLEQQSARPAARERISADRANTRSTFWSNSAKHVPAATLRRQHTFQRAQDKKSRYFVRNNIREEGVISNLFPLSFRAADASHQGSQRSVPPMGTHVYVYEVYATRSTAPRRGGGGKTGKSGVFVGTTTNAGTREGGLASSERRIPPARVWKVMQHFLRQRYTGAASASLPPLAQVNKKVYAAAPLPVDALVLPKKYLDIGWKTAELRLQRRCRFTELSPNELQMLLNKIVPHAARVAHSERERADTSSSDLEVVREKTGKLVFAMQCVSAGGLRMYRGVLVQAVFVDCSAASEPHESEGGNDSAAEDLRPCSPATVETADEGNPRPLTGADVCPISTRHLGESSAGLTNPAVAVNFQVVAFLRSFTYLGTPGESYRIRDASGVYLASLWAPTQPRSLRVGAVYAAAPVRIRVFVERDNARLIEFPKGTHLTLTSSTSPTTVPARPTRGNNHSSSSSSPISEESSLPGQLCLKIDTKGTIASEVSLWEEVLQHFGQGPYDEAAQQRIRNSVQGIPVVISYSLRQGIVSDVRFDCGTLLNAFTDKRSVAAGDDKERVVGNPESLSHKDDDKLMRENQATGYSSTPMLRLREPRLVPLLPHLDSQQPFAVLTDHTMVPLQVLHCCFEPRMRSWQDLSVSALSIMPQQRAELLESVRSILADGLQRWGITLASAPYRTKALSLLPTHTKAVEPQIHSSPACTASFPTTVVVIGVARPRCTAEQSLRIGHTAQHLAQYFRTRLVATVADERAAVQYVHEQLMPTQTAVASPHGQRATPAKDPNASVILVTNDLNTRATRWLKVECMCRGVHLIAIPASSNPKRLNLAGAQLRRRIGTQYEVNPLHGVDLRRDTPVLGHRHVLMVGVDTCHTNAHSVGAITGILTTPTGNHLLPYFWRHDARGSEVQHVAKHLRGVLEKAITLSGRVDEVLVFQDGDVLTELAGVKEVIKAQAPNCGLTYMCLHKRCNVRFMCTSPGQNRNITASRHASTAARNGKNVDEVHQDANRLSKSNGFHNLVKGVLIPALTPIPLNHKLAANSFYLQAHESAMSTARTVQYTVHHVSSSLDIADVQQMAYIMSNVLSPQSTKLPMPTRCAHRLADQAERLIDAVPQFTADMIPRPLCNRLWFL